jgi:predicted SnoaL-like aldol condensation-catalyzing enzyme
LLPLLETHHYSREERTVVNGVLGIDERAELVRHKRLVEDFCDALYNRRDFARAASMLAEDFVDHHPGAGSGRERAIGSFRRRVAGRFPHLSLEVRRMVADGDYVWAYGLIRLARGEPSAISVDIWRVADGRLAEHWDVGQRIPDGHGAEGIL